MAEIATGASVIALTTTGVTLFGVATGVHPELLIAGITGGLWALSYSEPIPVARRVAITAVTALVAGYLTPVAVALLRVSAWLPAEIEQEIVLPPVAVLLGFLAHRIIGPAVIRLGAKITEAATK